MIMYRSIMLFSIMVLLCGCATTAKRYERIDGEMVEVERLEIKGLGNKEAKFDKHTIKNETGFRIPDVKIEDFRAD